MDLVFSVALLGLAVILFNVFLLGCRMPHQPAWASETVISDLWGVTITGLIAFGTAYGVQFVLIFNEQPFGLMEAALLVAVLFACYLVIRVMAPRRRLAQYAGELARRRGASESSPAHDMTLTSPAGSNRSPGEQTLAKAA